MSKAQKADNLPTDKTQVDTRPSIGELDGRTKSQVLADAQSSINKVLIRDPDGPIKIKFPSIRDPEPPHKMIMIELSFSEIDVPHEEVLFYTRGVVMDRITSHSASVLIGNERRGHVFDRTYMYNGRLYHRCAWIPNHVERAGIMYKKMIHRRSRRPVAILKKFPGEPPVPMYQIIGGQEADYRDLRRIYERAFIKRKQGEEDDELDNLMYDAITPIESETTG